MESLKLCITLFGDISPLIVVIRLPLGCGVVLLEFSRSQPLHICHDG